MAGHAHWLQRTEEGEPPIFPPAQKVTDSVAVGSSGVRVANRGGEEFQEAQLRFLAGFDDDPRQARRRHDWNERGPASSHAGKLSACRRRGSRVIA